MISSRTIHADGISSVTKNGGSRNGGSKTLQVQEPLVLELICSRTTVQDFHLFKNNISRTRHVHEPRLLKFKNGSRTFVQELQFTNFIWSRTTVQELHRFIILLVQFGLLSGHLLGNSCPLGKQFVLIVFCLC